MQDNADADDKRHKSADHRENSEDCGGHSRGLVAQRLARLKGESANRQVRSRPPRSHAACGYLAMGSVFGRILPRTGLLGVFAAWRAGVIPALRRFSDPLRLGMRIKKIEIIGFKSFADREVLHIDDHVTGVIGPNGCGKSNIVDAIRWTLGEQRAKHLRGSGMRDVIFAGCATRGPGGMAEVSLTFDNDGSVPAAYVNYSEIAITRRLYSDGTSEYLINKVPCRLRDIKELMLGTGAGARGYSIIEQGQVGKIVSSKPDDRRNIIDEAAGITRFKSQKVAAERRIDQTQQNLLRVSDVLGELEGRLGTLRRQAQKAERYKRYREELRDLDLWTSSHRFLELQVIGSVLAARQGELSGRVDALKKTLGDHEDRIEPQRLALLQREESLKVAQQRVFDLESRLQIGEAEEGFRRREQESLRQAVLQGKAEGAVVESSLLGLEAERAEARAELEILEESEGSGGSEEALGRYEAEYEDLNQRLRNARIDIDRSRSERGRLETQVASLRAT
ncbi:MAG TPA: hypothetical protein ENJ18_03470, partial [Nannocystis exedens]|nr:hypothetical protein [Nannocystis exedens]